MTREASVERNTKETEIKLKLVLDGTGYSDIETGVGFFDHMLDGFARHGLFLIHIFFSVLVNFSYSCKLHNLLPLCFFQFSSN